jgi:hypothetical protein
MYHGLVRNLDYNSGFYGTTQLNLEHTFNVLDLPPASAPAARAEFVFVAKNFFIDNPFYEALLIHLAEGTDAFSLEEFTFMQSQSLLNSKGVVIHGIHLDQLTSRRCQIMKHHWFGLHEVTWNYMEQLLILMQLLTKVLRSHLLRIGQSQVAVIC